MEIINISSLDFYFGQSTRLFISSRTRVKKLGAAPRGLQPFYTSPKLIIRIKEGIAHVQLWGRIVPLDSPDTFSGKDIDVIQI